MSSLGKPELSAPRHDYIHAAILFADLENSVMLSATLPPADYDDLLQHYHQAMAAVVEELKAQGYPVGEYSIIGDQLALFLYDPGEILRNASMDGKHPAEGADRQALIAQSRASNENLVFSALRAAIQIKSRWLVEPYNQERVRGQREPLGLAVGLHSGRVYLRERAWGGQRIEGFAVNLAKRIEGFARHGRYSKIMLSEAAHDRLRGMVVKHTQLRQRVFFTRHELELELLKGVTETQSVFELKFYSRIGIPANPAATAQYETVFHLNPRNSWAYYQLFEHYAYVEQDWEKVLVAVKRALLAYPGDEKLLLDLARYYHKQGNLRMARELGEKALAVNADFDLALELLALIAGEQGDTQARLTWLSRAVSLAPGSPVNNLNFGLALCEAGDPATGAQHLREALAGYPEYLRHDATLASMRELHEAGKLPEEIAERFGLA